jgi:hypothetical protein
VRGSPGYASAHDILRLFSERGLKLEKQADGRYVKVTEPEEKVDARKLVNAFREQFLPHIVEAERNCSQLDRNYEHVYRRRNTALTLIFAMVMVLALDLPINVVYRQARSMTPEQAVGLAESLRGVHDSLVQLSATDTAAQPVDSARAQDYLRFSNEILTSLRASAGVGPGLEATAYVK